MSHFLTFKTTWRRSLAILALLSALGPLQAQTPHPAPAPDACPPAAQPPTQEQLRAAQAQARDHGALWRIHRDGRTSWLYGTLHLGKLEWAVPGPRTLQALRSADTVALELDISDPAAMAQLAQPAPAGAALVLPAGLQERLNRQQAAACLPAGALSALHPVLQVITLSSLDARWIGLDPGYGTEFVLAGFARSSGRPVIGLETAALQMQALVPARPEETLHLLEQSLDQLESGLTRRVFGRLAQAWADGDLDTVANYEQWCECITSETDRTLLRRLNDDRNPHLADRIAALHGEGRRLFAAVGLLHMTGTQALPQLLTARGFEVQRVPLR